MAIPLSVPPSVTVPAEVIVPPVKVIPFTLPVVATLVTVPLPVPGVYPNAVVTCKLVRLNVPPSVIVPEVVIVPPVSVNPLTDPAVAMLVTVPLPLPLNNVQSELLKTPLLVALAVGTFNVITGVVVPFATVEVKSIPALPIVSAATLVTVPLYGELITPLPLMVIVVPSTFTPPSTVVDAVGSVYVLAAALVNVNTPPV